MITEFTERASFIEIYIKPSTIEEAAMLLRMVKSSKKKKHRMFVTFSSDMSANISIEKVAPVHQANYLSND